jgi:hypothetical protein
MTRFEKWTLTGWDERSGVNPPPNEPKPQPPHWHAYGCSDARCGLCQELRRIARQTRPAPEKGRDGRD